MLETLLNPIKKIYQSKALPYVAYGLITAPAILGLGGGCDKPKPKNKPPVIETTSIPDAKENQSYNFILQASDPENDTYIFSKLSGPSWLDVHSNGSLTGKPNYTASGSETLEVICEDNHSKIDQASFPFNVENTPITETVSIGDIYQYGFVPVEGVDVDINGHLGTTNASGIATIDVTEEGNYTMTIDKPGYHTYTSDISVLANNNNLLEYIVLDNSILDNHYENVFLGNGTHPLQKPNYDTMEIYIDTTNAPDNTTINQRISILENEFPILSDGKFTATRANGRIQIGTNPPAFGEDNKWVLRWHPTVNGHTEYFNSPDPNLITSGCANVKPTADIGYYREEDSQVSLGARSDSDIIPRTSTIYETGAPENGVTDFTIEDKKIILRASRRPIGSDNN